MPGGEDLEGHYLGPLGKYYIVYARSANTAVYCNS